MEATMETSLVCNAHNAPAWQLAIDLGGTIPTATGTMLPMQTWIPLTIPQTHPCPTCGHCPHCGRGGAQFVPLIPYNPWPWQQPRQQPWPYGPIWAVDPMQSMTWC